MTNLVQIGVFEECFSGNVVNGVNTESSMMSSILGHLQFFSIVLMQLIRYWQFSALLVSLYLLRCLCHVEKCRHIIWFCFGAVGKYGWKKKRLFKMSN